MKEQAARKNRLEQALSTDIGREFSARTILFHQAIASLAGVSATDMKCLDYIQRGVAQTPGDLARETGLTTGAITAAIDRLERAELVLRERSEQDRRKVLLQLKHSPQLQALMPIYESIADQSRTMTKRYSVEQMETIHDYLTRWIEIMRQETRKITARSATVESKSKGAKKST
ncbi:MarR family winged helix-turn-helix transcriptional regulator [Dyella silvatica]|uniref:MarR family winged helix-turn-helix transcriptional regulator n=1 Tax=Dyella silvatica TaxID=2992128 RepID=UPI00224ECC91|nr:MarR family transcriptional regulator [Dyella silvatica]